LGSFCGLRNIKQIHQWAKNERVRGFLDEHFEISVVPCYYWLKKLFGIIKPKSLDECFTNWVSSLLPGGAVGKTISLDGKTIRSTGKMKGNKKALHIVSAQIAELGITFAQKTVSDKSNEIPAVRELLDLLDINGCMVVADAMHCQKETVEKIVSEGADYTLSVKDNQAILKQEIEEYVQNEASKSTMNTAETCEKNRGRKELRIAFTSTDLSGISVKSEWFGLTCIGAINRQVTVGEIVTNEWHYYISSRELTAEELLKTVRLEWTVETLHWLLDVHFDEDFCRVADKNIQQNLNIARKVALNHIHIYKNGKNSKRPISNLMFDCLLEPSQILALLDTCEN